MKTSMQEYMKVGIVQCLAYPDTLQGQGPILESVTALASDPFFNALEVTHIADDGVRTAVADFLVRAKVEPYFCAQPLTMLYGLDLEDADEEQRKAAIDAVKAGIEEAAEIKSNYVTVMSGKNTADKKAATERLIDSLKQLCAYAQPFGISLSIEAFDQLPYGKDCLIGPTTDAVRVSKAVRRDYPNFGILLDLGHLCLLQEDIKRALKTAGDHLVHVHLANAAGADPSNPYYGDNHPYFGAPGTCNNTRQIVECLKVLKDMKYISKSNRGMVSFEVKPDTANGDTSESIIAGAKRTLLDAWAQV